MVKSAFILLLFVGGIAYGQVDMTGSGFVVIDKRYSKSMSYRVPGLLAASATFTPGAMLNRHANNFYLSGFAEYHASRQVSFRGDTYFHLNGLEDQSFVRNGVRTYFGAFFHLNRAYYGNWDVKLGFQPGIALMQRNYFNGETELESSRNVLSPSFSTSIGFDYYVWKYFHFFANLAYVNSTMRGLLEGSQKTDELLFSAGLGFQIKTIKKDFIIQ